MKMFNELTAASELARYRLPVRLQEHLDSFILFPESRPKESKGSVQNGSVLTYSGKRFHPEILQSDVGCGITAFITEKTPMTLEAKRDILKAVDEMGIHIGQGDHFLDIATGHPEHNGTNMFYLHSDLNSENAIPKSIDESISFERRSQERRFNFLSTLLKKIGVSGAFYRDWTHCSVRYRDGQTIYRRAAIDLQEN